ncbi:MAG: hypothetical protein KIT33_07395 [Candidatus Kapabacteria bacterium]|nr:hypothetical protein [Ignavibacteriota bacterium]MCW5884778.1 hypothetical protein [Candidatus Kapabacteria bacterium]
MEKSKKMISNICFVILILCFFSYNLFSQSELIEFNGFSYRAKSHSNQIPKSIKKLEITNYQTGYTLDFFNNVINKEELILTSIKQDNKIKNGLNLMDINFSQSCFNLTIYNTGINLGRLIIVDIGGKEIAKNNLNLQDGVNNLNLPVKSLSDGFYVILIQKNAFSEFIKYPFIMFNNEIFLSKPFNNNFSETPQIFSSDGGFRFIAHPFTLAHIPDTVEVESLNDIEIIEFFFKDNAEFNFRTGNVKIENLQIGTNEIVEWYNPDYTIKRIDTNDLEKNLNLEFILAVDNASPPFVSKCNEEINFNNLVKFCKVILTGDKYAPYYSRFAAIFIIHSATNTLHINQLSEEKSIGSNSFGVYNKLNLFFKTETGIPYKINPVTGELEAEFILTKDDFSFTYNYSVSVYNRDFENNYPIKKSKENMISYDAITDMTKVTIVLTP